MKLVVQIPCLNEQEGLPAAIAAIPRSIPGVDEVEILVVDDGSSDGTSQVAKSAGADHLVRHTRNLGLARAFISGVQAAIEAGADIIVNTDADNQYNAADIPKLIRPILEGKADIVVGERPISDIRHFSATKKVLQKVGSWVVRVASKTDIPDAPSGFRAFSREAAMQLRVFSEYTYTLETIIQAGQKGLAITSVPIRTNGETRPSRLVRSIPSYVLRSCSTIFRIFVTYRPFRFFLIIGSLLAGAGTLIGLRFLYYFMVSDHSGHVQSLILAAILLITGFGSITLGVLADLISVNRKLLEDVSYRLATLEDRREKNLARAKGVAASKTAWAPEQFQ